MIGQINLRLVSTRIENQRGPLRVPEMRTTVLDEKLRGLHPSTHSCLTCPKYICFNLFLVYLNTVLIAALFTSAKGRAKCALTEDEEIACGTYMMESIHTRILPHFEREGNRAVVA